MKVSIANQLYIKLILLFPIFTLFQSYIGFLNKFFFTLLLGIQISLIIKKRISKKSFMIIMIFILLEIWALLNTKLPLYNLNDMFYLPFMIMYFEYYIYNTEELIDELKNHGYFIKRVIYLWNFLVLISIILPSSYVTTAEWGENRYFQSFTNSPFRLCPTVLFILTLVLVIMRLEKNRKFIIWCFIPMFCLFASGSRIYFGIGLLLFMIIWYRYFYHKSSFWLSLIPVTFIIIIIFLNSSIMNKFAYTMYTKDSYFDFWGTITNGRSIFWAAELNAFSKSSIMHKLFGNGFNYVYDVNYLAVHSKIWAHNDFLQVLMNYGYVGLAMYLISVRRLLRHYLRSISKKDTILVVLAIGIWFFNAFFNMFYTYFCCVLSFPLLMIIVKYDRIAKSET